MRERDREREREREKERDKIITHSSFRSHFDKPSSIKFPSQIKGFKSKPKL